MIQILAERVFILKIAISGSYYPDINVYVTKSPNVSEALIFNHLE